MNDEPKTLAEAVRYRYDKSSINSKGVAYLGGRCCASVADSSGWHFYQCSRNATTTISTEPTIPLYCKTHARKVQNRIEAQR